MNSYCVENHTNKKLSFVVTLSQMLKGTFIDGGMHKGWREHLFMIEPNRTGKGQIMNGVYYFLKFCNEEMKKEHYRYHYYSHEPNPQQLVGGWEEIQRGKKKDWIYKPGMLKNHNVIMWGEAENLIRPASRWGDMKNLILNALDDGMPISPTARKDIDEQGNIPTFYTNTSLITGTRPLKSINEGVAASGILQRFLFNYEEYKTEDYRRLRVEIMKLGKQNQVSAGRQRKKELFDLFYSTPYQKDISFNSEVINEYEKYKNSLIIKTENDFNQSDYKSQAVHGFITASLVHDKKIAAMITSLENEKVVFPEAFETAANLTQTCIDSISKLIGEAYSPTKSKGFIGRQSEIIKIIKKNGGVITRNNLVQEIKFLRNKGTWDIGLNKTFEFINQMEKNEVIQKKQLGSRNTKVFQLNDYNKIKI